ncbi:uncharacterized protein [Dendrobates tinctorius]|uniref:uncharacterized protein n=1 Tax=Dendrobates tinctorius TaxID=92724 RepID=UPI003CC99E84
MSSSPGLCSVFAIPSEVSLSSSISCHAWLSCLFTSCHLSAASPASPGGRRGVFPAGAMLDLGVCSCSSPSRLPEPFLLMMGSFKRYCSMTSSLTEATRRLAGSSAGPGGSVIVSFAEVLWELSPYTTAMVRAGTRSPLLLFLRAVSGCAAEDQRRGKSAETRCRCEKLSRLLNEMEKNINRKTLVREDVTFKERCRTRVRNRRTAPKRMWVHPIVQEREDKGHFNLLYQDLRKYPEKFVNFCRLTIPAFDRLLDLLSPELNYQETVMRRPISAEERLLITLRFLATGESYTSLHLQFRVGKSTIS